MDPMGNTLGMQVNTPLAYSFYQIALHGWCNTSTGSDEFGASFWLCNIEPNELEELVNATELDTNGFLTPYPGHYIVELDSDGNKTVTEYLSKAAMLQAFNSVRRDFVRWDAENCEECGSMHCLESYTMDGAEKKCVACGIVFDPAADLDEVTI